MAYLALVRHGKSLWNIKGLWQGQLDIDLAPEGEKEAQEAAEALRDIKFDIGFTSELTRAKKTLEIIKSIISPDLPTTENPALSERHYGIYQGKNKWQVKEEVGEDEFYKIRRFWDHPIPQGESLKQVYDRVVPYYQEKILPLLKEGKNVIVASSGNTLRALKKYLDNLTEEQVADLEVSTGEIHLYQIDPEGKIISKEVRAAHPNTV